MEKLAQSKRKNVDDLMTKLGEVEYVKVYLCRDGTPTELSVEEHGHFYQDEVYVIDVKGSNHRYLMQWCGPRLSGDQVSAFREYMAILTDHTFIPAEITRVTVMQGHEDDTLLRFFPNGFVCHDGPY